MSYDTKHLKIKLCVRGPCGTSSRVLEVRRLPLLPEVKASLAALERCIAALNFAHPLEPGVFYTDDDDDLVRVCSDREVVCSFEARRDRVPGQYNIRAFEFCVFVKQEAHAGAPHKVRACHGRQFWQQRKAAAAAAAAAATAAAAAAATCGGEAQTQTHFGIICDGCGASPIRGARYRCSARPNFDLCSKCKDKDTSGLEMHAAPDPQQQCGGLGGWASLAERCFEAATVAASKIDTKTDAMKHEAEGNTARQLEELRLATMASLETAAQELSQPAAKGAEEAKSEDDEDSSFVVVQESKNKKAELSLGTKVKLQGLSNEQYLGKRGTVRALAGDRLIVELDNGGAKVSLKPENLKTITQDDGPKQEDAPKPKPDWAAGLKALEEMGFVSLLGKPDCVERFEANAAKNGGVLDLQKVVSDIITQFDAA